MKKIGLLFSILFFSILGVAQYETSNWIMGEGTWLSFDPDPGDQIFIDNFFTEASGVSVSDSCGQLLFYSDNEVIFDKNHEIMPHGILENYGIGKFTTLVIPKPNTPHEYYLFIIYGSNFSSLTYKTIDMTLNGGLGDVTTSGGFIPNPFYDPIRKITAIAHSNQKDVWVLSHDSDSNIFKAWLATEYGIDTIPVQSAIGSTLNFDEINDNGQIKTSLEGDRVGLVYENFNQVEIFDFDQSTGLLSNTIILNDLNAPEGIEFSPSGQYVYISHLTINGLTRISQFDLWAGDSLAIKNSRTIFNLENEENLDGAGNIQLAVNGKIYCTKFSGFNGSGLGVINDPNRGGLDCNFESFRIELSNFSSSPMSIPTIFHNDISVMDFKYEGFCTGSNTSFSMETYNLDIDSVYWDFGDTTTGVDNFSKIESPSHVFSGGGTYNVTLEIHSKNKSFKKVKEVHIAPLEINLGNDTTLCENQYVSILTLVPNASYLWSDSSTNRFLTTVEPGTFWIEISVDTCPLITDTITIDYVPVPYFNLGPDGGFCEDAPSQTAVIDATCQDCSYQWNTGATSSSITISAPGNYSVTATLPNSCISFDGISYVNSVLDISKNQKDISCMGDSSGLARVLVEIGEPPFSFEWENGDSLYFRNDLQEGMYSVTVSDKFGCTEMEVFNLNEPDELIVNYFVRSDDLSTSEFEGRIQLEASGGVPPYIFDWENFGVLENLIINNLSKGIYPVTVSDSKGCAQFLEIEVDELSPKEILERIQLYPNPTNGIILLKINRKFFTDGSAKIYNALGQEVLDFEIKKEQTEIPLDLSLFSSGMYLLSVEFEDENKTFKIIRN